MKKYYFPADLLKSIQSCFYTVKLYRCIWFKIKKTVSYLISPAKAKISNLHFKYQEFCEIVNQLISDIKMQSSGKQIFW